MSVHFSKLRDKFNYPGIPLSDQDIARIELHNLVGEGDDDIGFFTNSLGKLRLRGKDTHWRTVANNFPDVDKQCFQCIEEANKDSRKDNTVPETNYHDAENNMTETTINTTTETSRISTGAKTCAINHFGH